jgi:hypothetical protein
MIIKNSIAFGAAAAASVASTALIFSAVCTLPTLCGVYGGAAFTSALCLVGGLISFPTLFGGLLSLLILNVIIFLIVHILVQINLSWLPV